ncbi:MAG: T9SS type A sorting domain-containing protein [Bacteroidales bacterium]|nr:T9SS type A sorting domain-containing protein [Bacteroidales bacterium]
MKTILLVFVSTFMVINEINAQWPTNPLDNLPVAIASGDQAIPKVATSETGISYISWFSNESGNYNVRLQKLDVFGNKLWDEQGLLVSDNPAMTWLTDWDMTVGHLDYAVLTFQDIRNGDNDVFAYRISPDGEFLWGEDGIELSTGPAFDAAPKVCVTNSGNAVFAWQADDIVILQKISPEGTKLWGDNGISITGSNTYSWPQLIPVGDDDVILKYFEDSGPVWAPTRHVFAQRYNSDGNMVWTEATVISNAGGISAWTQVFPIINDGNDGFYIAWHDDRDNNMLASVFVQHVDVDGQILLGDDGTEASTQPNRNNFYAHLAMPTGSDDIFVFWNEMDADQNNRGIYGQKISEFGERLWTDSGKAFIEISATNVYPFAASQSNMNMMVFYEHYYDGLNAGINAMQIDTEGMFVWEQEVVVMCAVQSEKVHPVAGDLFFDQWISVWEDSRNGGKDIYGQNIQLDGALGAITTELSIYPDSLLFEMWSEEYFYIENNSYVPIEIVDITWGNYLPGWEWHVISFPGNLPYTLQPGDSIAILVEAFSYTNSTTDLGWECDLLVIDSDSNSDTINICLNEDWIFGINTIDINSLVKCYPNPSKSVVNFSFDSKKIEKGKLILRDFFGNKIAIYDIESMSDIIWDCRDQNKNKVPPGIYSYELISVIKSVTGKIILK